MTVFLVLILAVNFLGTRVFGEMEFWFSSLKVIAIVGLIILGIILMAGGGPNHDPIGFRYWRNPGKFGVWVVHLNTADGIGPFNQVSIEGGDSFIPGTTGQFLAWFACLIQAAFSFLGTEIIATTFGEAQNPRKAVPKAIKRVFFRLMVFYVLGIFIIGVLVPYNDPGLLDGSGTAAASPFVIAIRNAGIPALPSIINAVVLIAAWSAGNADLYAASRTFYALALEHQVPGIFRKCTKRGLPIWAVAITALFGPLCYLNVGAATAGEVFTWLYNISTIAGIFTWWYVPCL
jgi:amino acid transporter